MRKLTIRPYKYPYGTWWTVGYAIPLTTRRILNMLTGKWRTETLRWQPVKEFPQRQHAVDYIREHNPV